MKRNVYKGKKVLALFTLVLSTPLLANLPGGLVDNFNSDKTSSIGAPRQFINDSVSGGQSVTDTQIIDGKLNSNGELIPARGQLGWASSVLLLNPDGTPRDLSQFEGIKLIVQLNKGDLSLSANSTEITNFDYHAALLMVPKDGKFHEVRIPFSDMKRAWSEQFKLNQKTINSLSIVAFSTQKASFDFSVDEVSFY
jgi:hypothetical protein